MPGLLASRAGAVAYAGPRDSRNREAIVAADTEGRVERAALTAPDGIADAALRLWRDADLVVAKLPPGPPGKGQLRDLLAARRAQDLVLVVQDPSHITRRLVATGAAGVEGEGTTLYSASTRTEGVVSATVGA